MRTVGDVSRELRAELEADRERDRARRWSGWATQIPGRLPKIFGAREIAELNCYSEYGQRLIYLVESDPPNEPKVPDHEH